MTRCPCILLLATAGCGGDSATKDGGTMIPLATIEEGPWQIKADGVLIGRAATSWPSAGTWLEFVERRTAWKWLGPADGAFAATWTVTVPLSDNARPVSPTFRCGTSGYLPCQKVRVTWVDSTSAPSGAHVPATLVAVSEPNSYHSVGNYQITASTGGTLTYHVAPDDADPDLRHEVFCGSRTFPWPSDKDKGATNAAVSWTMTGYDPEPWPNPAGVGDDRLLCPGDTRAIYTVDLTP